MALLENESIIKKINEFVNLNRDIFFIFSNVYIFGSIIKNKKYPHDVDLLLIYNNFSDNIINNSNIISSKLQQELNMYVDLTLLNYDELKQTDFLKKIRKYIKIK